MGEENTSLPRVTEEGTMKELTKIFGDSGTERYAGYFSEEENSKWRDEQRVETVYEMRSTDNAVKGVLNAIKSPILSAEYNVFSYDDSEQGEKIRADVEYCMFHLKRTFKSFLREGLGFLEFGHYAFEIIYEIRDGEIVLADLAPRIPRSIQSWQGPDKQRGIMQLIRTDEFKTGTQVFIPIDKLVVFTNDMEGDDITGQSILRSAYIHWKMKNLMYRLDGVSKDRYGVGVPVVTMPENFNETDKANAEEGAKNLRSSEKSYMVLPNGYTLDIKTPNGTGIDMMPSIAHHNRMIMVGILAQFMDLGADGAGSYALSGDQTSFFLHICEEKAKYFDEVISNQVIKRYVDIKYGPQETYPELRHNKLGNKDLKQLSDILVALKGAGFIDVDTDLKQWTRQRFDIPELTDQQMEEMEKEEPKEQAEPEQPIVPVEEEEPTEQELSQKKNTFLSERPYKLPRKLTEQEQRVDFKALNDAFNESESDLEDELSDVTADEIERYTAAVQKKLDAGDIAGIGALSYGIFGASKKAIETSVKNAYLAGKTSASKELGIDRPSTPLVDTQIMAMDVEDNARAYQFELEQRSRELIKDAVFSGASTAAIVSAIGPKIKDEASKLIANMSGTVVGQYINRGRSTVFQKNLAKITGFQRSEVLDNATCFPAGTNIHTISGSKPIESVKKGDLVLTTQGYKKVSNTMQRAYEGMIVHIEAGDSSLFCTEEHPVFANGKWIEAKDLLVGDQLVYSGSNVGYKVGAFIYRLFRNSEYFKTMFSKKGIFPFIPAFVSVPVSSINLYTHTEFIEKKINRIPSHLSFLSKFKFSFFKSFANLRLNSSFSNIGSIAGDRTESFSFFISRGHSKTYSTLDASKNVSGSSAFFGTMTPFSTIISAGIKYSPTPFTRLIKNCFFFAFKRTESISIGVRSWYAKFFLALGTHFKYSFSKISALHRAVTSFVSPLFVVFRKIKLFITSNTISHLSSSLGKNSLVTFLRTVLRNWRRRIELSFKLFVAKGAGHIQKYSTKINDLATLEVFNLEVEDNHEYFANGVLVHNCNMCMSIDGRTIKADDPMAQLDITHSGCRGTWAPIYAEEEQPDITGIPKSIVDSFDTVDGRPRVNAFQQLKKPINAGNKAVQELIRRKLDV